MTVGELVKELSKCDPDLNLIVEIDIGERTVKHVSRWGVPMTISRTLAGWVPRKGEPGDVVLTGERLIY